MTAAAAGVSINISVETNSARVQKHLVAAGHGWAILPAICVADDLTSHTYSIAPLAQAGAVRELRGTFKQHEYGSVMLPLLDAHRIAKALSPPR